MNEPGEITRILTGAEQGDEQALQRLIPIVYSELRRLAAYHMQKERPDHTLQATALVHEVYLRLTGSKKLDLRNRAHFFAVASNVMRNLLVDHARARKRAKRGGGGALPLDEALTLTMADSNEVLAIHDALDELTQVDARQSRIVEMKYFGGMSVEEIAAVLGISDRTVKREWQMAKAWLYERAPKKTGAG
jgi:RNA polymerase sigma factor (TIGR02999 family)